MLYVRWSSASGDTTYVICYVTSQCHVTEGLYVFNGGSSTFPSLVATGTVVVEI